MNEQPFQTPPRWWPPKMTPWLVRLWRPLVNRELTRRQQIVELRVEGMEHVRAALTRNAGVLITANHSFHYDSYAMIEASHRVGRPFHYLTAWQVFQMSKPLERWFLQRHGCFSINREGTDLQAFKQSIDILRASPFPLVIFPEGDIYHVSDRLTPFRDGAAAIAMSAAKKATRPIVAVPCGLKATYLQDPTQRLEQLMSRLEEAILWRPRTDLPLVARLYRFAEGLLSLKEIEYLGGPQSGSLRERTQRLSEQLLARLELKHGLVRREAIVPERVKEIRRAVIKALDAPGLDEATRLALRGDLHDLFFVIQLFSYPGDYVAERPTIHRIAETLDKFEEDVLRVTYPAIHGQRRVTVRFGEPVEIPKSREQGLTVEGVTDLLEQRVQSIIDQLHVGHEPQGAAV